MLDLEHREVRTVRDLRMKLHERFVCNYRCNYRYPDWLQPLLHVLSSTNDGHRTVVDFITLGNMTLETAARKSTELRDAITRGLLLL